MPVESYHILLELKAVSVSSWYFFIFFYKQGGAEHGISINSSIFCNIINIYSDIYCKSLLYYKYGNKKVHIQNNIRGQIK